MTRRTALNLTLISLAIFTTTVVATPTQSRKLPFYHLPTETRDQVLQALPKSRVMMFEVTAYCPCKKCCGPKAHGVTASGRHVSHNDSQFVAADTSVLPFHSKIVVPGYATNGVVPVLDRGGAIKGNRLDVFFPTHQEALEWGRRMVEVIVIE